jgi:hypothetical protein
MSEPKVVLYAGIVGSMTLKGWRNFGVGDFPFTIECNGLPWAMTPAELGKLSRAAGGIIAALSPQRDGGKRPTPGRRFHAEPRDADGEPVSIELGIEASGDADLLYFRFGDDMVRYEIGEARDLLRLFMILGNDLEEIERAARAASPGPPTSPRPGTRWMTSRPRSWSDPEIGGPGW